MAPDRKPRKDTPYLALTGVLWGVFCANFGANDSDIKCQTV